METLQVASLASSSADVVRIVSLAVAVLNAAAAGIVAAGIWFGIRAMVRSNDKRGEQQDKAMAQQRDAEDRRHGEAMAQRREFMAQQREAEDRRHKEAMAQQREAMV